MIEVRGTLEERVPDELGVVLKGGHGYVLVETRQNMVERPRMRLCSEQSQLDGIESLELASRTQS